MPDPHARGAPRLAATAAQAASRPHSTPPGAPRSRPGLVAVNPAAVAAPPRTGWLRRHAVVFTLLAVTFVPVLIGLPYYLQPLARRVRHPMHPWLKPTGIIGQLLGILAFTLFVLVCLYPLRKKFRWLAFTGPMSRWLNVHIAMGLLVPWLAAIHAGFRFEGLIGVGYLSMLLVVLSGFVGKYLYARIPRSRSGLELTLGEVEARRADLVRQIGASFSLPPQEIESALADAMSSVSRPRHGWILLSLISNDIVRWTAVRRLRRRWRGAIPRGSTIRKSTLNEVIYLARRQIALTQQVRILDATQRVFRYWHVAHRPVTITAILAVVIHVVAAVTLGVTWFW